MVRGRCASAIARRACWRCLSSNISPRETLRDASAPLGLVWRRRRVGYPLWYELRPLVARLRGHRAPSRFDLWTAEVR
jgi:hypothetical protein